MEKTQINSYQDERISRIEKHIETINSELGEIKIQTIKIKTDVCWLKRFFWIVATSSIGALLVSLFNLLLRK